MATSSNCLHAPHQPPTISGTVHGERFRSHLSREKPQLSCSLCRKRKVRCDRQTPCTTCSRRGLASFCVYNTSAQENILPRSAGTVHERIHQLESLVISLMQQNMTTPACETTDCRLISDLPNGVSGTQPTAATAPSRATESAFFAFGIKPEHNVNTPFVPLDGGCMKSNSSGMANYVGSSHWAAVLDSIAELKEHFEQEEDMRNMTMDSNPTSFVHSSWPQLLYGYQGFSKVEILSSIPPRRVVDRLVSRYFTLDIASGVFHSGQFLREYEHFWEDQSAAPIMWVGLLFTIMCLGALQHSLASKDNTSQIPTVDPDIPMSVNIFRERIVQCLMLGKYTKGGPYVLESLMQYYMIEHFLRQDAEFEIWILLGMLIPISLRMGLHRDAKHFSEIPAFVGEMRRRLWATIFQIDVGFSAMAGLPRMIKPQQCDTEEPRNLLDSDFDDKTLELPQSRPESEVTPVLFLLAKNRIISVGGLISDLAHDVRPYPYSELMRFEKLLEDTRNSLPSSLRWQPLSQSIIQSPQVIMQTVYLDMFFYKMRIILYKKYLSVSISQPQYNHVREVSLDSATKILEYQHLLEEETKLDGRLSSVRWTYSSILNDDFMLAASVLCFYVKQYNGKGKDFISRETFENIQLLLRKSREIWLCSSSTSKEAQKAVQSLSIILGIQNDNKDEGATNHLPSESDGPFDQFNKSVSWPGYQDYFAFSNSPPLRSEGNIFEDQIAPLENETFNSLQPLNPYSFKL